MSSHRGIRVVATAATAIAFSLLSAVTAEAAMRASGQQWSAAVIGADGGRIEGCRTREDSPYGPLWRVQLRGHNRAGTGPVVVRGEAVRGYDEGNSEGTVIQAWQRRVVRGAVTRSGVLRASELRDDRLRLHLRRPDGTGTLTWVVRPEQLPPCGAAPGRNWGTMMRHDRVRFETCSQLVGGIYGPVWRIRGRGNNSQGDDRYSFGMQVRRDDQVIDEWNASAAPGEITRVRMLHASLLLADELIGGMGNDEGGFGGDQAARWFAVC